MVRAPCCEKMGLKKGPWTPEEDQILISYIQNYGHGNWRALPKQAGLLRCGKSCRLRWINYLRPDIKRGNFSNEEEETIFRLHQMLGNRWSAIAARLPGRTDNEIKNYWHSHLKKRLERDLANPISCSTRPCNSRAQKRAPINNTRLSQPVNFTAHERSPSLGNTPSFPQETSVELLSISSNMEDINDYNSGNDMEFWYDLFIKSENSSREVHGNLGQFG